MRLIYFLAPRLLIAAITMFGVALLVFLSLRLIPGGYADIVLGPFATGAARDLLIQRYGLDEPIFVQFGKWLWALLQGDFGNSMVTNKPVIDEFLRRAPVTGELAILTLLLALAIGLPLGVWSGLAEGGAGGKGRLGRLVGALGASVPDFVIGSAFIFIFSKWSLGLKVGGFVPLDQGLWDNLKTMILPTVSLSVFAIALFLRTTRDAVLRVMTDGHILAAVARGQRPRDIVRHHVLRNAAIPVVTVTATYFGFLLGGAVIAEVLFSIPGVGYYIFSSLEERDYAVVQAGVLLAAFVFVSLNMVADFAYALIDPRIGAARSGT
ncbi:ABC transporter permease [Oceanibacterium hippocampi]|uniref:Dipeptide transport system permease protein DppB n=1 Tax=Oceanibacterium hippocampi TaxID=745714 RepID=A0A1Y5TLW5_9PROT|nr:ABC transporter permease [Oceanibacterium hippocampi]SLN63384.1 Dipeptide transport system permease protein DppB [Oceanibacterium hippocampi]